MCSDPKRLTCAFAARVALIIAAVFHSAPLRAADDLQYVGCKSVDQQNKRAWYMSVFPASRSYDAARAFGACLTRQRISAPAPATCESSSEFAGLNARLTAENKSLQASGYELSNMDPQCLPGFRRRE